MLHVSYVLYMNIIALKDVSVHYKKYYGSVNKSHKKMRNFHVRKKRYSKVIGDVPNMSACPFVRPCGLCIVHISGPKK